MGELTVLDILKVLDRSNCKECGLPTCMAFAAEVIAGNKRLEDCPRLDPAKAAALDGKLPARREQEWTGEEALAGLQDRFSGVDLAARAEPLGGWMRGDRLVFHCLGKVFAVDPEGGLHSECHQNPWLHVPLLSYVLDGAGKQPAGDWARFSEIEKLKPWSRFFAHRCEEPLQELAEGDPDLLLDILDLFASRRRVEGFHADASFLLHPLPRVPFLFAYRGADDELPAQIMVYLDRCAPDNLDPESVFRLGSGMAQMFRAIAIRHGHRP